jgi:hypothetical protein
MNETIAIRLPTIDGLPGLVLQRTFQFKLALHVVFVAGRLKGIVLAPAANRLRGSGACRLIRIVLAVVVALVSCRLIGIVLAVALVSWRRVWEEENQSVLQMGSAIVVVSPVFSGDSSSVACLQWSEWAARQ